MKKLVLTIVCAVCALLVSGPLYADEGKCGDDIPPLLKRPQLYCGDSVTYQFDEATGTLTISGKGRMRSFRNRDDLPWRTYQRSIRKVVVEKGITSIGSNAFCGCENLFSVTLPEGLTDIESFAFSICSKINYIDIPSTVERMGTCVFSFCESLLGLVVPASLEKWNYSGATDDWYAEFAGCSSLSSITWNAKNIQNFTGFWSIRGQIKSFKFGNSVKFIPANICKGMGRIKTITLPKSVEEIGESAFSRSGLVSVTCYAPKPPVIGDYAFRTYEPMVFYVPGNSVSDYNKVILHTVKPIQK